MKFDAVVVGIGSLNFDYIHMVDTLASGDEQSVIKNTSGTPGGSAANVIYGLVKFGVKTAFFGVLGNDPEGDQILNEMQKSGIDTSKIKVDPGVATSRVLVFVEPGGERAMYSLPGASIRLQLDELINERDFVNEYTIISAIPDDNILDQYLRLASNIHEKTKIVFLPGALYSKIGYSKIEELLLNSYMVILNRRELSTITQLEDPRSGVQWLGKKGCENVVVTLGSEGCLVGSDYGEQITLVPAIELPEDKIIDSTGAGDAFVAGLVYGLISDKPMTQAALLGNLNARACIQALGARARAMDEESILIELEKYSERMNDE